MTPSIHTPVRYLIQSADKLLHHHNIHQLPRHHSGLFDLLAAYKALHIFIGQRGKLDS